MLCCNLKTLDKLNQTKKTEYKSTTALTFFSSIFKFFKTNFAVIKLSSF